MGLISTAVATTATLTGGAIGLALGTGLALAAHGAMAMEDRK